MYNLLGSYSVEYYIGEKRSGKTFSMTYDTFNNIHSLAEKDRKKITIYSNYKLNEKFFPGVKLNRIEKEDLEGYYKDKSQFSNCIFLIDEMHAWVDSRSFMRNFNKHFSYFMGQMAKRGNILRATTHSIDFIDLRARFYAEKLTYVYKGFFYRNKFKMILNYNEQISEKEEKHLVIKREDYVRKLVQSNRGYFGSLPEYVQIRISKDYITDIYKYFGMYNTDELIES